MRKGAGIADQRPSERHPLLLAAGQFARPAFEQVHDVEHLRCGHDLGFDLGAWQPAHLQRERQVLENGLLRVERVVLEHHGDVPVLGIEIVDQPVADVDVPAGHRNEAGNEIERRRLAAAGRADQSDELSVVDRQRNVVDGQDRAITLDDVLQYDSGHGDPKN